MAFHHSRNCFTDKPLMDVATDSHSLTNCPDLAKNVINHIANYNNTQSVWEHRVYWALSKEDCPQALKDAEKMGSIFKKARDFDQLGVLGDIFRNQICRLYYPDVARKAVAQIPDFTREDSFWKNKIVRDGIYYYLRKGLCEEPIKYLEMLDFDDERMLFSYFMYNTLPDTWLSNVYCMENYSDLMKQTLEKIRSPSVIFFRTLFLEKRVDMFLDKNDCSNAFLEAKDFDVDQSEERKSLSLYRVSSDSFCRETHPSLVVNVVQAIENTYIKNKAIGDLFCYHYDKGNWFEAVHIVTIANDQMISSSMGLKCLGKIQMQIQKITKLVAFVIGTTSIGRILSLGYPSLWPI